jgi:hypothetical protein
MAEQEQGWETRWQEGQGKEQATAGDETATIGAKEAGQDSAKGFRSRKLARQPRGRDCSACWMVFGACKAPEVSWNRQPDRSKRVARKIKILIIVFFSIGWCFPLFFALVFHDAALDRKVDALDALVRGRPPIMNSYDPLPAASDIEQAYLLSFIWLVCALLFWSSIGAQRIVKPVDVERRVT